VDASAVNWPHLMVLPIVLPLLGGAGLVLLERRVPRLVRPLSATLMFAGLLVALGLLGRADSGAVQAYLVGNWPAPFGVVLVLDRLAALMLLLTAVVGCASLLYATGGDDRRGRHFHSLFHFQLMGLNGAFLTADLFNLFVFFEVLLIASYGLLLHGAGPLRLRAGLHYVAFNLAGSSLFLVAASLLYGLTGTLNFADLAQRVPLLAADRTALVQSAALLLLVVFGVKAALLPLYFWLPATYGAASAPVAALFAIMTKVGVYAILRTTTLVWGAGAGAAAGVASPWLDALALATLMLGAIGALAAVRLRALIGQLVIASAGTLLLAVALARPDTVSAGLFYLVNSSLVVAALFLLADRLRAPRGALDDALVPAHLGAARLALGALFFVLAAAAAGVPPLAGFLGKALLLQAAGQTAWAPVIVASVLASSLLVLVALARAGSQLFWKPVDPAGAADTRATDLRGTDRPVAGHGRHAASLALLTALLLGCAVFAGPLAAYTRAAADQLFDRGGYLRAVLQAQPVPAALDVRREMRERRGNPATPP
jgi:multicomponent K+:H+ antiporter subunit D